MATVAGVPPPIQDCTVAGNSDLYGLGIRIGIYLQWATALIANYARAEDIATALVTNTIFLAAVCISSLKLAVQGTLQQAEYLIVIHIAMGFVLSVLTSNGLRLTLVIDIPPFTDWDVLKARLPPIGLAASLLRQVISILILVFTIWYWWTEARSTGPQGCVVSTFLFTKVRLSRGVKIFEIAFAICALLPLILEVALQIALVMLSSIQKIYHDVTAHQFDMETWTTIWTALNENNANFVSKTLARTYSNVRNQTTSSSSSRTYSTSSSSLSEIENERKRIQDRKQRSKRIISPMLGVP